MASVIVRDAEATGSRFAFENARLRRTGHPADASGIKLDGDFAIVFHAVDPTLGNSEFRVP